MLQWTAIEHHDQFPEEYILIIACSYILLQVINIAIHLRRLKYILP